MKYPKLKFNEDKRRSLSRRDIIKIKHLFSSGMSLRSIGRDFGVSKTTIKYHVSDNDYRSKVNKKRYGLLKESYIESPALKKQKDKEWSRLWLQRCKVDLSAKIFKSKSTYAWKKRKYHSDEKFKLKTRKQAMDSYYRKRLIEANTESSSTDKGEA